MLGGEPRSGAGKWLRTRGRYRWRGQRGKPSRLRARRGAVSRTFSADAAQGTRSGKARLACRPQPFCSLLGLLVGPVFQSVACNAAHTVQQRAAKWLLAAMDRTGEERLALTQEQLAGMLGTGGNYFTRVARRLSARARLKQAAAASGF